MLPLCPPHICQLFGESNSKAKDLNNLEVVLFPKHAFYYRCVDVVYVTGH